MFRKVLYILIFVVVAMLAFKVGSSGVLSLNEAAPFPENI